MKTAETRICMYCHRRLPLVEFPIKIGFHNVRYKVCRECRKLGHSCVQKTVTKRKVMTPEERIERRREYMRRYRLEHPDKFAKYSSESKKRKANGIPPRKPGPRPGNDRDTRICVVCKRKRPLSMFLTRDGKRSHSTVCVDCRPTPRQKQQAPKEKPVTVTVKKEKGCIHCVQYPCFTGIENLESDFSLTCLGYKRKEAVQS